MGEFGLKEVGLVLKGLETIKSIIFYTKMNVMYFWMKGTAGILQLGYTVIPSDPIKDFARKYKNNLSVKKKQ